MADVDAALAWAQANPQHPQAKAVMAKAWAMQNPKDPRSAQIMAKLQSTVAQSQNPQQIPDAADKAAQGEKPGAQPISMSTQLLRASGKSNPQLEGQIKQVTDQTETAKGVDQLGTTLLPGAASAMSKGAGLVGRLATAGGLGGTTAVGVQDPNQSPSDKLSTFLKGGSVGMLTQGVGEGLGAGLGALKNMYQTGRMAANPAAAQDKAISAISDATDKLKSSEAENLAQQLGGKSLPLDTSRITGVHPEIDGILDKYKDPYGAIPSSIQADAQDVNKIRQLLDGEVSYKKLGPFAQQSEATAAKDSLIKGQADKLRGQIHEIGPEVSDTLEQWSDNLNAARNLDKRAQTAPMTVLSSPSFDRRALLQKVDEQAGTDLQGLGQQIENAKDLSNSFHNGLHPIDALFSLGKAGIQGASKALKQGSPTLTDPRLQRALEQGLFEK